MNADLVDPIDLDSPACRCPKCGGRLQRIHRRLGDRVLSLFQPVIRCRCESRACGWRGPVWREGAGAPRLATIVRSPLFIALALLVALAPLALSARYVGKHLSPRADAGHVARELGSQRAAPSSLFPSRDGVPLSQLSDPGVDPLRCASAHRPAHDPGAWRRFVGALGITLPDDPAEQAAAANADLLHCADDGGEAQRR